eukprot:2081139-Prymnesium_polylepis.1
MEGRPPAFVSTVTAVSPGLWAVARTPPTGLLHSALSLKAVGVDGGIIANKNGVVQRASAESDFLSESAE